MKFFKKRFLALAMSLVMVFSLTTKTVEAAANVSRINGKNRYETSVKLSNNYDNSDVVVLANGKDFPDALAGSGLASSLKAPLLLVDSDTIPSVVSKEIERLNAKSIIVLGGKNTIKDSALSNVNADITRIAGSNRYDTSIKIAENIKILTGLIVVNGNNFPDALSAGGLTLDNKAVILTDGKTLDLPKKLSNLPVTVLGGNNSVSENIASKYNADRISGKDRYQTSLLATKKSNKENVLIADGTNYPDALSAITLANKMPASILLTSPKTINEESLSYIDNLNKAIIIGGPNSISANVENALKGIAPSNDNYGEYQITRVVDGDTIEVIFNGNKEKVRLIGVNTPESVHPDKSKNTECGLIASNFTKSRLESKKVGLEFDVQQRDKYGRLLAYVWTDGQMFNKILMEEGMAQVATFPPNTRYESDFRELQRVAMEKKIGLWGQDTCNLISDGITTEKPNNDEYNPNNPKDGLYTSPYPGRLIKGNITGGGKIYHIPGQAYYDKTSIDESKGERWFSTEKEAQIAGWRASKR